MILISSKDFRDRLNELKILVSEGNIKRSLKRLIDVSKELNHREAEINAISLSSRYQLLEGEYKIRGLLSYEEYAKETNKVSAGVLSALSDLEEYFNIEEKLGVPSKTDTKNPEYDLVVSAKGLFKQFEYFKLSDIDIELKPRTITGLIGGNGSGKTTLIRILSGLLKADKGELRYFGLEEINWFKVKQDITYISQAPTRWIMPLRVVLIYYCTIRTNLSTEEVLFEVERVINRLDLKFYEDHDWATLPGGLKTRFEIARALVTKPKLLILDEPLANLDPNTQGVFLQDIRDLISASYPPMAAIISSQHIKEVEQIADEILLLANGEKKFYGKKENILREYKYHEMEISCDLPRNELANMLKQLNEEIDILTKGTYDILSLPITIDVNDVIGFLVEHKVQIEYINDISKSSKKML